VKIIMTTLFGIESITARELMELGYEREQVSVSDGQVVLDAGSSDAACSEAVARLNIHLGTAERVLLSVGSFFALTFEELYDQTRKMPWEKWIPKDYAFHVKGYARKSRLYGISACQSLIKKAIVDRLLSVSNAAPGSHLLENPSLGLLRIQFANVSDRMRMMIDTSGDGLHKRGYRPLKHEAPIRETLASAILRIGRFHSFDQEALLDPLCGSGTFPIEAALISIKKAPGLERSFAAEHWPFIGQAPFDRVRRLARERVDHVKPEKPFIFGSDRSEESVLLARTNAERAGVSDHVRFFQADIEKMRLEQVARNTGFDRNMIVCNPPYGERMLDTEEATRIQKRLGDLFLKDGTVRPGFRYFILTPDTQYEQRVHAVADKRRKLYNGMIPCTLYQYFRQRRPSV
jgi:putative N6-adenine-specific DNA methylase